jgi:hypothetical protein
MRWALILVGIAGCFNPSAQPGSPCGDNGACPGALVCVNGTCERSGSAEPDASIDAGSDGSPDDATIEPDAPMFDAGPMDNDGDGVTNASDNCPQMANNDQHDEDNDSIGDACDNCPHVANANQAAAMDNDSVGDVCDPYPTMGGDSIVRFLPMHVTPPMISTLGTWQQMNDDYVHTSNGDSALIVQGGPWTNPTILVSARQEANIVPLVWMSATVGESSVNGTYAHCGYMDEVYDGGASDDFHRASWGEGTGVDWDFWDSITHFDDDRLAGTFSIRLRGNAQADTIDCTVNDARGMLNTGTKTIAHSPNNVGIRSEGITYSVKYIVVFNR